MAEAVEANDKMKEEAAPPDPASYTALILPPNPICSFFS